MSVHRSTALVAAVLGVATVLLCPALSAQASPAQRAPVHTLRDADSQHVGQWLLLGPFPNPQSDPRVHNSQRLGYNRDYLSGLGGEAEAILTPATSVTFADDSRAQHSVEPTTARPGEDGYVDVLAAYAEPPGEEARFKVAYAFAWVEAERDMALYCFFGSDDSAKVWVNNQLALDSWAPSGRGWRARAEHLRLRLQRGMNRVLVKVENHSGPWGFSFEIVSEDTIRAVLAPKVQLRLRVVSTQARDEQGDTWRAVLRPELTEANALFAGRTVALTIRDADGELVASEHCPLGNDMAFEIPSGPLLARAHAAGFPGRERWSAAGILAQEEPMETVREAAASARRLAMKGAHDAYAGWFAYLAERIEKALEDGEEPDEETARRAYQVAYWREHCDDVDAMAAMRGSHEWAYLSRVDGTGQPFSLHIPRDYDPAGAWPLQVYLHGMGGTHGQFYGEPDEREYLALDVMGRARGGSYVQLSEVDVLEALDYVMQHWSVAPERVHLCGSSMGGFGTFNLTTRFPDRFASAVPWCGGGLGTPLENLLHVPLYSVHSDDDWVVLVSLSRAAVRRLTHLGYRAIQDETTGLGHGVWQYREGIERSLEWAMRHRRPAQVSRVVYTATDGLARGAYWAEVFEWGPEGRPAHIDARLDEANTLYLSLDNVAAARFSLHEAPLDAAQELMVVVGGRIIGAIQPPLPTELFVSSTPEGWHLGKNPPELPDHRLHFPGGIAALYQGEPLMVVWGTQGDEGTNAAMKTVADAVRSSCRANWPAEALDSTWPMRLALFGRIPGKPDHQVTDGDIARHNLILLGTARQNSVVARIADRLLVKVEDGRVQSSDGESWDFAGRALHLTHYNPDAPDRLVGWFASQSGDFYQPGMQLLDRLSWGQPPDFILLSVSGDKGIAARRFDSRWRWESGYAASPHLPAEACTSGGMAQMRAASLRRATGADFVLVFQDGDAEEQRLEPAVTRLADLTAWEYGDRAAVMEITGSELLRVAPILARGDEPGRFIPRVEPESVEKERLYTVAMHHGEISDYGKRTRTNPRTFRLTEITFRQVMQHCLRP